MELRYVEVKNWDNLGDGDIVLFKLPERQIEYRVVVLDSIFCSNAFLGNTAVFDYLKLDATDFTQNIVGYPCKGLWPRVKSIDDLKKVIKALDYECVKKFGECNTPKFKVGDKVRVLPRNSDIFYSPEYVNGMTQYAGQIYTISEINGTSGSITLEQIPYFWDSKALELVDKKEESKTVDIYQAKDGDYISITNHLGIKYIVLFRDIKSGYVIRHASYNTLSDQFNFDKPKNYGYWGVINGISRINYATEKEKQLLNSKLLEAGYRWNNSTKELEVIEPPINIINLDKPETQFEAELNLFPTKKHYQLNFNY